MYLSLSLKLFLHPTPTHFLCQFLLIFQIIVSFFIVFFRPLPHGYLEGKLYESRGLTTTSVSRIVLGTYEALNKYLNISSRTQHKCYFPRKAFLDLLMSVTPILFSQRTQCFSSGPHKEPKQSSKMAPRDVTTKAETRDLSKFTNAFLNQNPQPSLPQTAI